MVDRILPRLLRALLISAGMTLIAQSPSLPLSAQIIQNLIMPTGSSGLVSSFNACESQSMHLAVLLPDNTYQPIMVGPSGVSYPWNINATGYSCMMLPIQPDPHGAILGYAYHFVIPSPANGQWGFQAIPVTALTSPWQSLVSIDFVSSLGGGLFLTAQKTTVGTPISASLIVMDGPNVLSGFNIVATLTPQGNPSAAQPVTFSPITNPKNGNTTLVAQVTPTTPGMYSLTVVITGTTSAGAYERDLATTISVYPKNATLTGQITQRVDISFPPPPQ